jgi:hypothetical protein
MIKYLSIYLFILCIINQSLAQRDPESQLPVTKEVVHHQKDFKPKFKILEENSFYQSKDQWQAIIDSTWGPGLPYEDKLEIFNTFTQRITNTFDGFNSLQMSMTEWDSIRNYYFMEITDSTSKGRFMGIMSHVAGELNDLHTHASDDSVSSSPLNPGTPLLLISGFFGSIAHFGAVLTVLPDSSLLVIRSIDAHPLDLQPGDIILGYEGIPWKILVNELLDAQLPVIGGWPGAPSAHQDALLISAGMNWHLFETIDIIKYASGDTLHLAVAPLIDLPDTPMLNNEQVALAGIPFPDFHNEEYVSSGIIEGTNIGYIYLFAEEGEISDQQFHDALVPLLNTEGLIIDLRLNFGGWSFFDESFEILFNEFLQTIEDSYRCGPSDFDLCPFNNSDWFQIPGNTHSIFDRPIAVLLGPTCVSMGDITAQRLRYHPMAKFFGKPPAASLGDNLFIDEYENWNIRYSISDMFHVTDPGNYLNRSEFPIDSPVWHNPVDVANGEDAVVRSALEWMDSLVYAHDVLIDKMYAQPGLDSVLITAVVENSNMNEVSIMALVSNNVDTDIDSLSLYDDGEHGDGAPEDSLFGNHYLPKDEKTFKVSVRSDDLTEQTQFALPNVKRFTSIGPVVFDDLDYYPLIDSTYIPGNLIGIKMYLKNIGTMGTAPDIRASILSTTPLITVRQGNSASEFNDIAPDMREVSNDYFGFTISADIVRDTLLYLPITIYSDDYPYWYDSLEVAVLVTDINDIQPRLPAVHALQQNYPNPFNPKTIINYELPMTNEVDLSIYNLMGQRVSTLVSEKKKAGYHQVEWDASGYASGVYYYRIEAGDFQQVRKMVLLK